MPIKIFLNAKALSAGAACVSGPGSLDPIAFPDIVAGNKLEYRIFLCDGDGGFETISGDTTDYTQKLAIGNASSFANLVQTSTLSTEADTINGISTSGWQGTIDASDVDVTGYVTGLASKEALIEFQVTETASGLIVTYMQMKVVIRNHIL